MSTSSHGGPTGASTGTHGGSQPGASHGSSHGGGSHGGPPAGGPPAGYGYGAPAANLPDPTRLLSDGWHCLHVYYRVNAAVYRSLSAYEREQGADDLRRILTAERDGAPTRLQGSIVSGARADLGLMLLDPDPLKIDTVLQEIRGCTLGPALDPVYSFVSITEVSEYVPTLEQYAERLKQEGTASDNPAFAAKMKAYEQREVMMRKQRLFPDFPPWPVTCFYPMNKIRDPHANWYAEPFSRRMEMMTEHGKSGMKFAGKVTQLITASTGLDDWEWGVTLWGRTPEYIKEIVYTMRFDEASARYAQFGPFYVSYVAKPDEITKHLKL